MVFKTAVVHAHEGYLPETLKVEGYGPAFDPHVEGYGYNDGYEPVDDEMSVVVIEADNLDAAYALWLEYAIGCSAIRGADDDHYDYFPSNFSALVHLGRQIDEARGTDRCLFIAQYVWDQLARQRWDAGRETLDAALDAFELEIHPRPTKD